MQCDIHLTWLWLDVLFSAGVFLFISFSCNLVLLVCCCCCFTFHIFSAVLRDVWHEVYFAIFLFVLFIFRPLSFVFLVSFFLLTFAIAQCFIHAKWNSSMPFFFVLALIDSSYIFHLFESLSYCNIWSGEITWRHHRILQSNAVRRTYTHSTDGQWQQYTDCSTQNLHNYCVNTNCVVSIFIQQNGITSIIARVSALLTISNLSSLPSLSLSSSSSSFSSSCSSWSSFVMGKWGARPTVYRCAHIWRWRKSVFFLFIWPQNNKMLCCVRVTTQQRCRWWRCQQQQY